VSCTAEVSEALATLPWVEPATITTDRKSRQVRFAVKDRTAFDPGAVTEAIAGKGFKGARMLTGLAGPQP
jgi:hypothetical protein